VDRALLLLKALAEESEGLRLTDAAARTELSPSTAHRLLTTLEYRNFVQFDPSSALWHVGHQSFAVGSTFIQHRNFVAAALPFLRRLRDQTRETANLGIIHNGEMVVLTQVESREIMRAITRVGGRSPLTASGMGKAILATYAAEDVAAVTNAHPMKAMTPRTIINRLDLNADLEVTAARGYAIDNEEYVLGLRCVAAVVRDHQGEPLCALSVSGLAIRMTLDRLPELGKLVADSATKLSQSMLGAS
tara:strand:- start:28246 stop:28986 length:741 start_codon:yes stop_codon:yes gene_type:complete